MRTAAARHDPGIKPGEFARWRKDVRERAAAEVRSFVTDRCAEYLGGVADVGVLRMLLIDYTGRGKFLRSALVLAGWLTAAEETAAAVRAAASVELLHCFALLQDDVMDGSPIRRGAPAAQVFLARWHAGQGLSGSAGRFGESAALLASDLCLVWAERLLRDSGVDAAALARAMPRYDRLRSELAVGQFRDLVNDSRRRPSFQDVREVARAKSGHYSVRRPVELGADLAGGSPALLGALGRFGDAVGEAFQFRDDLLGLFGAPGVTGKPVGEDLRARKATCVMIMVRDHADPATRCELRRLDDLPELGPADVARYLDIIETTGGRERVEQLIENRLMEGLAALAGADMPTEARDRLTYLAKLCVRRIQ